MKPLSWVSMLVPAVGGLLVGAALSFALLNFAYSPPLITPWLAALFLVVSGGLLWAGSGVKKYRNRESSRFSAIDVARIALFSRSAALTGALLSGFLGGVLLVSLLRTWAPATASAAFGAGVSLVGALVMGGVGWLVESWCVDDVGDSDSATADMQQRPRGEEPGSTAKARANAEGEPLWPAR